jgi:hypothetical protein
MLRWEILLAFIAPIHMGLRIVYIVFFEGSKREGLAMAGERTSHLSDRRSLTAF